MAVAGKVRTLDGVEHELTTETLTIAELGRQFVPRGSFGAMPGGGTESSSGTASSPTVSWSQSTAGKYVIVMPVAGVLVSPSLHRRRLG